MKQKDCCAPISELQSNTPDRVVHQYKTADVPKGEKTEALVRRVTYYKSTRAAGWMMTE